MNEIKDYEFPVYNFGDDVPYDLDDLKEFHNKHPIKRVFFEYEEGSYEGYGNILIECVNGKWYHDDLSHCSCYGPLEGIMDADKWKSLIRMKLKIGGGLFKELIPFFDYIRKEIEE